MHRDGVGFGVCFPTERSGFEQHNWQARELLPPLQFSVFFVSASLSWAGQNKRGFINFAFPFVRSFLLGSKSCRSCCCCPVPALAAQQFLEQAKGKQQPLPCIQLRFPSPSLLSSQWHRNGGQNLGTALRDCRYGKITAFLPWISGGGFP